MLAVVHDPSGVANADMFPTIFGRSSFHTFNLGKCDVGGLTIVTGDGRSAELLEI